MKQSCLESFPYTIHWFQTEWFFVNMSVLFSVTKKSCNSNLVINECHSQIRLISHHFQHQHLHRVLAKEPPHFGTLLHTSFLNFLVKSLTSVFLKEENFASPDYYFKAPLLWQQVRPVNTTRPFHNVWMSMASFTAWTVRPWNNYAVLTCGVHEINSCYYSENKSLLCHMLHV